MPKNKTAASSARKVRRRSISPSRRPAVQQRKRFKPTVRILAFADDVFDLTNQARIAAGLRPLQKLLVTTQLPNGSSVTVDQLSEIATLKARDMRDQGYFAHTSPTYGSPGEMLDTFGVAWTAYGENIAAGQLTPEAVMNAWLNSPGHRANILNPNFTYLGVGYVPGNSDSEYRTYWTQLFVRL
ncbi:CAP domain-containing protein [Paenibacillus sp. NPDC058071]|uniref:CAP domain-containing protein n=1 Tax=Paenibacillus sp. NPDC058071 TaxID=3346326 RepID=UPI0036D8CEAD